MRMQWSKLMVLSALMALVTACAAKAPVQEMAEARAAIETVHQLPGKSEKAEEHLKIAESSLEEATSAIELKWYETARRKAIDAKLRAQMAARIKQSIEVNK